MPRVLELMADKLQHSTPKFSLEDYWINHNKDIYLSIYISIPKEEKNKLLKDAREHSFIYCDQIINFITDQINVGT